MMRALRAACLLVVAAACAPEVRHPSVNQPPLPVLALPDTAVAGESVAVDGNASSDVDGIVSDVFLLFGDGTEPVAGFTSSHVFAEPGQFLVELYIHDNDGAGARARRRIEITPAP